MADLVITAADVIATDAMLVNGRAGATITAGQIVYQDITDSDKVKLADATSLPAGATAYMALNGASDGQPVSLLRTGDVALGGVLTAGSRYFLSGTAGAIQEEGDLGSGEQVILLGLAKSATVLVFRPQAPGVTL